MENNEKKASKLPKPFLSLLTIATTAGSIADIITKAVGFLDLLNEQGTDAFKSLIRPAVIAGIALIISISYLSSTRKAKKRSAEDPTVSKASNIFSGVLDFLAKCCIILFIVVIIAGGVYGYLMYKEYSQRPRINVLDYVDMTEAISGYDGEATYDKDKVSFTLPNNISKIYELGGNYDNRKDYIEEQGDWSRFLNNLEIDIPENTSGLSNDDELTLSAEYHGTDLSAIKASTHIVIEGIGTEKTVRVGDIKELPYRFSNAKQAYDEKKDVIKAAVDRLKNDITSNPNVSDYKYSILYCKPKYNTSQEPDGLAIVAGYTVNKGKTFEEQDYSACYIYPFDSRVTPDITSGKGYWTSGAEIQFVEGDRTKNIDQLELYIRKGEAFDSNVEYEPQVVEETD